MPLDPKTNRTERERKKALAQQPPPLDPPFPFRRRSFDLELFGLETDPPRIEPPQLGSGRL